MRALTQVITIAAIAIAVSPDRAAASARSSYESALARERALRAAMARGTSPSIAELRSVASSYRAIVRRYPISGYSDNALWQAALLLDEAFTRFHDDADQRLSRTLLAALVREYPYSKLIPQARSRIARLDSGPSASPADPPAPVTAATGTVGRTAAAATRTSVTSAAPTTAATARGVSGLATLRNVRRTVLPDVVRVTLELDGEASYRQDQLSNPSRMFVDFRGTRADASLLDTVLTYDSDAVRQIKLGRHPNNTTRVVVDLDGVARYSVFTLYNPFRLVIDCERPQDLNQTALPPARPILAANPIGVTAFAMPAIIPGFRSDLLPPAETPAPAPLAVATVRDMPASASVATAGPPADPIVVPTAPTPVIKAPPPVAPSANLQGGFSLARQLGLGISRIVIDAGHGGHDPGAQVKGLSEADLVLDVALRLEKELLKHPGVEVVMTRRSDVFVPLEERTAIANRASADLFLSIHANASRSERAHGVETYYLNFASNPDAEAVAARENSASGSSMNSLPDIVKAIALNNKLDESRDFATLVQNSIVSRLRVQNKQLRDLGVKQAPFMVLIGAAMPSVLAEISFVTNKQEALFLKSSSYRQRIADALLLGITNYQLSLKRVPAVADGHAQGR